MKKSYKILLAGFFLLIALTVYFGFYRTTQNNAPSLLAKNFWPQYPSTEGGLALLCLTNGSDEDFSVPIGFGVGEKSQSPLFAFIVERKDGKTWSVESDSKMILKGHENLMVKWHPGKAWDLRIPIPADGKTRRVVLKWKKTTGTTSTVVAYAQQIWWKMFPPKSDFHELRSVELRVEPISDYDFEATRQLLKTKPLVADKTLETKPLNDSLGISYSTGRNK